MNYKKSFTIAIDARFYGDKNTGLGVYLENLTKELEKIDKENNYIIYLRKENFNLYRPQNKNFKKVIIWPKWYSLAEQIFLPFILYKARLDLIHFPHWNTPFFYTKNQIFTIHDITPKFFLSSFKKIIFDILMKRNLKKMKKIIAVSYETKKNLIKYYNANENKIKVIYEGVQGFSPFSKKFKEKFLKRYKIKKPYFLYVGHWRRNKNLENLLKAVLTLKEEGKLKFNFVFTGYHTFFYKGAFNLQTAGLIFKLRKNLKLLRYVSRKELAVLYSQCCGLVLPSLSEGFGFPPLEALSFGKVPVVSNIPALKEILGDGAIYFNPSKPKEIANKIFFVFENEKLRAKIIKDGQKRLKFYSFKKMAEETHKIYLKILNSKS